MNLEQAYRLARTKLDEHGLHKWDVMFDGAKSRFGCCWHSKKLITLSQRLIELNAESAVLDTILHEIAHALVSSRHGHDKVWRQKALEIGCDGKRCYDNTIIQPVAKYMATCGQCSTIFKRFKAPPRTRSYWCRGCYEATGTKNRLTFIEGVTKAIASY